MSTLPDSSNGHSHFSPEALKEIEAYILRRLPDVLKHNPDFATWIEGLLAEKFPKRDEFARLLNELTAHRAETREQFQQVDQRFEQVDQRFEQVDQRFEQVDQRFEQVDQRFEGVEGRLDRVETELSEFREETREGFRAVQRQFDRFGARWGIRNEMTFRATMRALLEESFGMKVEERHIDGEQYDVVIANGDHILIEIAASTKRHIAQRLLRKRARYTETTGVEPTHFLYVVGSIYSRRAEELRNIGIEVVEPEIDEEDRDVFPEDAAL